MHSPCKADFILVKHRDANEKLGFSSCSSYTLTQIIALVDKVIGITCDSSIPHMSKFYLISPREEAVEDGGNLAF